MLRRSLLLAWNSFFEVVHRNSLSIAAECSHFHSVLILQQNVTNSLYVGMVFEICTVIVGGIARRQKRKHRKQLTEVGERRDNEDCRICFTFPRKLKVHLNKHTSFKYCEDFSRIFNFSEESDWNERERKLNQQPIMRLWCEENFCLAGFALFMAL